MDAPTAVAGNAPPKTGFLDLSAELKNKIYRLALCANLDENEYIDLQLHKTPQYCRRECRGGKCECIHSLSRVRSTRLHLTPNILRTCKQVRAEAISILYGENAFAMDLCAVANAIDQSPSFAQVRSLKLGYLDDWEVEAIAIPRLLTPERDPIAAGALEAIEKMTKLRTLVIDGGVDACVFDDSREPKDMAQNLAKNLRRTANVLMMKSDMTVREVLKLTIGFSDFLYIGDLDGFLEEVNKMVQMVYENLEADLEGEEKGTGADEDTEVDQSADGSQDGGDAEHDDNGETDNEAKLFEKAKSFLQELKANTERERQLTDDGEESSEGEEPSDGENIAEEEDTDDGFL